MAPVGRPPVPTKLKLLRGNPGKRKLNTSEPQPEVGVPSRPEWLLPEAKREWARQVAALPPGLLTKVDRAALAQWCQCWARYVEAEKDITENGTTFVTEKGYEGPRPSVGIASRMIEKMATLAGKLGFTPSDRARISLPEAPADDPFAEFLKGKQVSGDG